jgi:predicted mannosyl-3-phosphoglycerate phosphatase (HAD superfamily)
MPFWGLLTCADKRLLLAKTLAERELSFVKKSRRLVLIKSSFSKLAVKNCLADRSRFLTVEQQVAAP